MNDKIKLAKEEINKKNYEKALTYLKEVDKDDKEYELAQAYTFPCFMELKNYREALISINYLIEKNPYSSFFWGEKARCHIFIDEKDKALKALEEVERLVDVNDKERILSVAHIYSLMREYDKVIEYCDKALAIDGSYKPALYEKMIAASGLKDDKLIDGVSDDILKASENDLLSIMPIFVAKLLSGKYEDCLDLVEYCKNDELKGEFEETLKILIYKNLTEDLNAQVALSREFELSVDDAIKLMFDFKNDGIDQGTIHGIQYFIL